MLQMGVIGFGYWGPNIVRNFSRVPGIKVVNICDQNPDACARANLLHPEITVVHEPDEVFKNLSIDAVAVITPVSTHYALVKKALLSGKHVFVEKPFTLSVEESEELIELAASRNLQIMVDHTFLFTGAVKKIKEVCDSGDLGDLLYYDSTRVNLGLFQHDVNVIWDLAPHDFSIMDFVSDKTPLTVAATGFDHFQRGIENTAYVTVTFDNMIAHFNLNWLSPVKVRNTMIGGSSKMLVWNNLEADEKIRIYDKGVDLTEMSAEGIQSIKLNYRTGDAIIPRLDHTEALSLEAQYFLDCLETNTTPINGGEAGLRVVRLLVAADDSLRCGGQEIRI